MFSERLREARKAKHYSQAEVSRLLGVTQQAVGKWETGRSTPDPQTVARLAEILDTTADMLLGLQSNADAHGAVGSVRSASIPSAQFLLWGRCAQGTMPLLLRKITAQNTPA